MSVRTAKDFIKGTVLKSPDLTNWAKVDSSKTGFTLPLDCSVVGLVEYWDVDYPENITKTYYQINGESGDSFDFTVQYGDDYDPDNTDAWQLTTIWYIDENEKITWDASAITSRYVDKDLELDSSQLIGYYELEGVSLTPDQINNLTESTLLMVVYGNIPYRIWFIPGDTWSVNLTAIPLKIAPWAWGDTDSNDWILYQTYNTNTSKWEYKGWFFEQNVIFNETWFDSDYDYDYIKVNGVYYDATHVESSWTNKKVTFITCLEKTYRYQNQSLITNKIYPIQKTAYVTNSSQTHLGETSSDYQYLLDDAAFGTMGINSNYGAQGNSSSVLLQGLYALENNRSSYQFKDGYEKYNNDRMNFTSKDVYMDWNKFGFDKSETYIASSTKIYWVKNNRKVPVFDVSYYGSSLTICNFKRGLKSVTFEQSTANGSWEDLLLHTIKVVSRSMSNSWTDKPPSNLGLWKILNSDGMYDENGNLSTSSSTKLPNYYNTTFSPAYGFIKYSSYTNAIYSMAAATIDIIKTTFERDSQYITPEWALSYCSRTPSLYIRLDCGLYYANYPTNTKIDITSEKGLTTWYLASDDDCAEVGDANYITKGVVSLKVENSYKGTKKSTWTQYAPTTINASVELISGSKYNIQDLSNWWKLYLYNWYYYSDRDYRIYTQLMLNCYIPEGEGYWDGLFIESPVTSISTGTTSPATISYGYEQTRQDPTNSSVTDHFYNLAGIHFGQQSWTPSCYYSTDGETDPSDVKTANNNHIYIKISQ